MSDLIRPLGEYLSLLEQEGLLADPVPDSLDRSCLLYTSPSPRD